MSENRDPSARLIALLSLLVAIVALFPGFFGVFYHPREELRVSLALPQDKALDHFVLFSSTQENGPLMTVYVPLSVSFDNYGNRDVTIRSFRLTGTSRIEDDLRFCGTLDWPDLRSAAGDREWLSSMSQYLYLEPRTSWHFVTYLCLDLRGELALAVCEGFGVTAGELTSLEEALVVEVLASASGYVESGNDVGALRDLVESKGVSLSAEAETTRGKCFEAEYSWISGVLLGPSE